jgi:ASC-1-like (ASCH) protein
VFAHDCSHGGNLIPAFLTKKEVYDWIKTGRKTIELRKGKVQRGEKIAFLNGRRESVRGRILRKREGHLDELLNSVNYKRVIPTARNLDDAVDFVRRIYQSTAGTFATYEFEIEQEKAPEPDNTKSR